MGTYFHAFWSCSALQHYWKGVVNTVNDVGGLSLPLDPVIRLLGLVEGVVPARYKHLFVFYPAYYGRREILLRWKALTPPTVSGWKMAINSTLPIYTLTYASRNCPHKFDKVCSCWVDGQGVTV